MTTHPDLASLDAADEPTRVRIGASQTTAPEIILRLANDPSPVVRGTIAMNRSAPPHVDRALARDSDERVRVLLARKLATLAPNLPEDAQARMQQQAVETLTALVADEAVRVRAAIAEEVKSIPDAPRAVILQLAQDSSIMVCEPVIRFSPLLSQADLLALLASAPCPATALAVARRADIDERVSDALAQSASSEAIRALLANRSAQIREATLDALVARAVEHKDWHEPLVRRPSLPPRAARTLSEIVATNLLEVLAARPDFDAAVAHDLRERLTARLAKERRSEMPPPSATSDEANALAHAQRSMEAGLLDEDMLLDAVRVGDTNLAVATLATAAQVPVSVVERAASLRSLKGLVSLTWRGGFTMRSGTALQALLARVPPSAVLQAGLGGNFPLTVEEMRWKLDFRARTGR